MKRRSAAVAKASPAATMNEILVVLMLSGMARLHRSYRVILPDALDRDNRSRSGNC
jgi:hypothetical protein